MPDIPLYSRSKIYSDNLIKSISVHKYSVYKQKKLVNFAHKFDQHFKEHQKRAFLKNPERYKVESNPYQNYSPEQLLDSAVSINLYIKTILKVFLHQLFLLFGLFMDNDCKNLKLRKCYVEDVEALFDSNKDVLRLIYPFPLSIKRQWRYIKSLRKNNLKFVFSGFRYRFSDFLKFMFKKTYLNLYKLEINASIRDAKYHSVKYQVSVIETSDEYDIGSYTYAKALDRKIFLLNSAHGVSSYLPYQHYSQLNVLNNEQKRFYSAYNKHIKISLRSIRLRKDIKTFDVDKPCLVLLGQYSPISDEQIRIDELALLDVLDKFSKSHPNVYVYYKIHPNNDSFDLSEYSNVKVLKGEHVQTEKLLQISLFSTCQIDPNFKGEKYLIETQLIKPEFAFGKDEPQVYIDTLSLFLEKKFKPVGE